MNEISHLTRERISKLKTSGKKSGHPSIGTMKKFPEISDGMNITNKNLE